MSFVPAREILHNQLMRLEFVRSRARRSHNTGIQQNPDAGAALLRAFERILPTGLGKLDVLELGPGRGTGLMAAAVERGVGSYAAFDIEPYLSDADLPDPSIDYRIGPNGNLAWPSESFDLVWSHSVMEHVRDPRETQLMILDVLRPGGYQLADIDLVDHYQDRSDPMKAYSMLRYSDSLWRLMTSNRSSFTNRLRVSQWTSLLAEVGFEIAAVYPRVFSIDPERLRSIPYLKELSDEDILTHGVTFVLRKPVI